MRKKIQKGAKLFKSFNGAAPAHVDKIVLPEYEVVVKVGNCTRIAYLAEDGKEYIHTFKPRCRPILAVSEDGKHLLLAGGKYRFTDRGIVDA